MTTVAQFITSSRYDLRDYGTGLEFDDEELLEYINRMVKILDSTLISINSSFVVSNSTLLIPTSTLRYDIETNLNSGNFDSIREIWTGNNRLEKISMDLMWYKQRFNSDQQISGFALVVGNTYEILARTTLDFTGCGAASNTAGVVFVCTVAGTLGTGDAVNSWNVAEPQFWTRQDGYIVFELPSNQIYGMQFLYNKLTATLTTSSNMPYNNAFNEFFRELLVMHAKAKKEGTIAPTEQTYSAMFRKAAYEQTIRADFQPKYYKLDF